MAGTQKYPVISCQDALEPRANTFSLEFASKDAAINYRDSVEIKRDGTRIFLGFVMAMKPALTPKGHAWRVSGMNMLGKHVQLATMEELLLETEAAELIRRFNIQCRKISTRSWTPTAISSASYHPPGSAIDRDYESYWKLSGNQTLSDWFKVGLNEKISICRVRIEHEIDCHPQDIKLTIGALTLTLTSAEEFDAGTFDNTERAGSGDGAYIILSSGGGLIASYTRDPEGTYAGVVCNTQNKGWGPCINIPSGFNINKIKLRMNTPPGTNDFDLRGKVHNITGTLGTDAKPDCNALATSTNTITEADMPQSPSAPAWITFNFSGEAIPAGGKFFGFRMTVRTSGGCTTWYEQNGSDPGNGAELNNLGGECAAGTGYSYQDFEYEIWGSVTFTSPGYWTSAAINSKQPNIKYDQIKWTEDLPSGTDIEVQFKAADTEAGLSSVDFEGPTGTGDWFTTAGGESIPSKWDGKKYYQYKVKLTTTDSNETPRLDDISVTTEALDIYSKTGNSCRNLDFVFEPHLADEIKLELTGAVARGWAINELNIYSSQWPSANYYSDALFPMPGDVFTWNGQNEWLEFSERRAEIYQNWDKDKPRGLDSSKWKSRMYEYSHSTPDFEVDAEIQVDETDRRLAIKTENAPDPEPIQNYWGSAIEIDSEPTPRFGTLYVRSKVTDDARGHNYINWINFLQLPRDALQRDGEDLPSGAEDRWVGICYRNPMGTGMKLTGTAKKISVNHVDLLTGSAINSYHDITCDWRTSRIVFLVDDVYKDEIVDEDPYYYIPQISLRPHIQRDIDEVFVAAKVTRYLHIKAICFSSIRTVKIQNLRSGTSVSFYDSNGVLRGGPTTVPAGVDYVEMELASDYSFPMHGYFVINNILEEGREEDPILPFGTITEQQRCVSIETKGEDRLSPMAMITKIVKADIWGDLDGKLNFGSRGSDKSKWVTFKRGEHLESFEPEEEFEPQANDVVVEARPLQHDRVFKVRSKDSTSIGQFGRLQKKFPVENIDGAESAYDLADKLVIMLKNPLRRYRGRVNDVYEPNEYTGGDQIHIKNEEMGEDGSFYVLQIGRRFDGKEKTSLRVANEKSFFTPEFKFAI